MITGTARYLGLLAAALALSACASMDESETMAEAEPMAQMAEPAPETAEMVTMGGPFERHDDLLLVVNGQEIRRAVSSEERLERALGAFDVPRPRNANLGEWILEIRNSGGGHGARTLLGLGGMQGRDVLRVADRALNRYGDYVAPPDVDVWGRIQEECEDENGNMVPGYYFNGNSPEGSGHLCVTVVTEGTDAQGDPFSWAEKYFVVVNRGFHVEDRDYNNNNTAFPAFTQASGLAISQGVAGNFETKLWASGISIRVERLWVDTNYDENNENFTEVVPGNPLWPIYAKVFNPNPDACIDMMFVGDPPHPTLPPNMEPPKYCLGRCDEPPLINTR